MKNDYTGWERLDAPRIRGMIALLNAHLRSELALECIHRDVCVGPLKKARKAAEELNFWLHELRKELDGQSFEEDCGDDISPGTGMSEEVPGEVSVEFTPDFRPANITDFRRQ